MVYLFMRRYGRGNLGLLILCEPVSASQFFPLSLHLVPELSIWLKNTLEPRRVEHELHRSASAKLPAVSNLNNESLCINIDEWKTWSWNFAMISDCVQEQKVSYCTKEAWWLHFLANMSLSFKYVKSGHYIYNVSNYFKQFFEQFNTKLLTTGSINMQVIYLLNCPLGLRTTRVMAAE